MKDCIKQTEFGNGTPNHLANLTKLEILYRQLQQRHQYDLEQHFAITESLKIKAKDAQNELIKFQRQYDEMSSKYQDEQKQSANKVRFSFSNKPPRTKIFSFDLNRSLNWRVNYVMLIQQQC